jgi:hypothetical protein
VIARTALRDGRRARRGGGGGLSRPMTRTSRAVSVALIVAAFLALAPASALAGPGLYITLHNDLLPVNGQDLPVRVALHDHGGSDCWYDNDLAADMNS